MNRHMAGLLIGLLTLGAEPLRGQVGARVEYRNGRIGVAVAIGEPPARIAHRRGTVVGRVAVELKPRRSMATHHRIQDRRGMLTEGHLRQLLGKGNVRQLSRHARAMGLRGALRGQWFRVDRQSMLMEITVRGALVAEVYDYGRDGYPDQLFLIDPHGNHTFYQERRGYERRGYNDTWWDDDGWKGDRREEDYGRRPEPGQRR